MVTATTSRSNTVSGGAFTTISERVTIERDIKKSKFIAIAGHISDERSAQSFLSEVIKGSLGSVNWLLTTSSVFWRLFRYMVLGFFTGGARTLANRVQDPRATHNCWAYKVGNQYRSNDDGEPSGTAGKPIHSAIENSGLDRVMVVVIRHFGGIKLGTGGLVRAYGGVATECLKSAPTRLIKSQVPMGVEVSFDLLGVVYHQLQSFKAEDIKQDYDTGKDGITMVTFKISFDQAEALEEALKTNCSRNIHHAYGKVDANKKTSMSASDNFRMTAICGQMADLEAYTAP
ncbi:IMPACT family protein [Tanacetum coccineum]